MRSNETKLFLDKSLVPPPRRKPAQFAQILGTGEDEACQGQDGAKADHEREGLIEQDKKVAGYVHEQGKGLIIVVNKWDLIEKDDKTMKTYTEKIKSQLLFMSYAPIIFVSALTGQRVGRIIDIVKAVAETRLMRLPTSLVNEIVRDAVLKNPPPTDKGKRLKIFYATQVDVAPPTFALFVNDAELMHFSYLRYLENCIRKHFAFEGTTIRLELRNKKEG